MSEWVKCSERLPPLKQTVLVTAKEGSYFPEVHGKDERKLNLYVGFFFDDHADFVSLKPKIIFEVECGCSGYEFDRAYLEPIYWMPLPKPPEDL
jgi:hypothetical protein